MAQDPCRIETVEQLREVIGEPSPVVAMKVDHRLDEFARAYIERSPFVIMATADAEGNQDVSPKGDAPGFVLIEDDATLVIPDRKGNQLVFGLQNLLQNPHIGLIFLIPGTGETLRINGTAALTRDPALLERLAARGKPAVLAIRVHVEECLFHCAKAFLRAQLWKPEAWGERHRVSLGAITSKRFGAGEDVARQVDELIADDYRNNL
jgi:PPOX class probable FMN-dependent enzyme